MKARVVLGFFTLALAACVGLSDPCPVGSRFDRAEHVCLIVHGDASTPIHAQDGQVGEPGQHAPDGSLPGPTDAGASDGRTGDAALLDAGDASSDDRPDGQAKEPMCSAADVDKWAGLHREDMRETLELCGVGKPETDIVVASACVRDHLRMKGCEACTDSEARCVADACRSACGTPGSSPECRACACEVGCVELAATCAGRPIDVCEDVYGRDASLAELTPRLPTLFRMKRDTGFIASGPLEAAPNEAGSNVLLASVSAETCPLAGHWSTGFAGFLALMVDGRAFLLQHKAECSGLACIARISPLLSDGTLGRPAYLERWDAGWDLTESFQVGSHSYLLRYKTGQSSYTGDPKGTLLIERVTWDEASRTLTLRQVLKRADTPAEEAPWSRIEAFAHAGATHLFFFGLERNGEARIMRVLEKSGVSLQPVSELSALTGGWDLFETFAVGTRWFLLSYKSGAAAVLGEPAGTVRVQGFVTLGSNVALSSELHQSSWPTSIKRVIGFQNGANAYLFRQDWVTGPVQLIHLSDPSSFPSSLGQSVFSTTWGKTPPWDIAEIVGAKPW
jgi:hypothetical protein